MAVSAVNSTDSSASSSAHARHHLSQLNTACSALSRGSLQSTQCGCSYFPDPAEVKPEATMTGEKLGQMEIDLAESSRTPCRQVGDESLRPASGVIRLHCIPSRLPFCDSYFSDFFFGCNNSPPSPC
ncbi:unnamed protein product [Macrosiphum euphorbiae]|uniref:Uncharacterized protein n=1 Tax=Macrosiphum euphorbiae TaxID=13131 RepID=A0AAV0WA18_9HEMI|nr:unnamed protein product [Macrosiphum euphorbiae]